MKADKLLKLSIISSIIVILYMFFVWNIIDIITPFLIGPVWLAVFGFFIWVTVYAIKDLIKNKNWKPIPIQMITVLLVFFFPFTDVILDINFKIKKDEREEIIKMVETETLKSSAGLTKLPDKYKNISDGGEIVIERNDNDNLILFFTYRGMLDNFSGYVYSPNDQKPVQNDFDGEIKQIEKIENNWYFVGSN
jgi:energy-coupling factor transporter transmembrane protein EcfT